AIGWRAPVPVRAAACLAQGGEFGLLLLTRAISAGLITSSAGQPVLVALAVSMGFAPAIVQRNEQIGRLIGRRRHRTLVSRDEADVRQESEQLNRHVILLGCGRIGRLVAAVLDAANVPYLALEIDVEHFQAAKRRGHHVVLADGSRPRLLNTAGLRRACLLIITFYHLPALRRILQHARPANPGLPTLLSTRAHRGLDPLHAAGCSLVS